MDTSFPVVLEDNIMQVAKETTEQKRKRLAAELRFTAHQFNSKLLELMETDVEVEVRHGDTVLFGEDNLVGLVDVSFQPATRRY